ncbi:restriction endonuclease [Micromonospora tulbaghiae]|uniref:restriction endonuclease n=1 Tax=Micromonospora tulbaghiae TaxID=479978 RepID=UPI003EB79AB8
MDWKQYQREVAAFLSSLGFDTKVDETVHGARAVHDIDVTARSRVAGVNQLWIVECKLWKRPVPKERVLTFRGVVEDVGADRGVLFSESGFQSGAKTAAQKTNISLTSFADFERDFSNEVAAARARTLDLRLASLMQAFDRLWDLPQADRESAFSKYCGPSGLLGLEQTPHAVVGVTARLSQMRQALEDAQFGRWPVAFYPLDHDGFELIEVRIWDGLFFVVEQTLEACERIYAHMTDPKSGDADWRDFQSTELTELLRKIRSTRTST